MIGSNYDLKQTVILDNLKHTSVKYLKQYQLDKLLFNITGVAIESSFSQSIKFVIKKLICNSFDLTINLKGKDLLLFTYDYKRKDHTDSWNHVKKMFAEYDEIKMKELTWSNGKRISYLIFMKSIFMLLNIMREIKDCGNIKERLIMASQLVELVRLDQCIDNTNISNQVVLTYFDGGSYENLIIQKLKNKGVKAVTMQHGQPVFHGYNCDRINQTMILNYSSDYVIVTGEYSKKQFCLGGIPEKEIVVAGALERVVKFSEKKSNKFVVFFDCPTYADAYRDNYNLIHIAEYIAQKYGMKYIIKLHPQDKVDNYSEVEIRNGSILDKDRSVEYALDDVQFAILHASGVYLKILAKGVKAFCMTTDMNFPLVEYDLDKFKSADELDKKIGEWNEISTSDKENYMSNVADYYLGPQNSMKIYADFIQNLMD